MNTTRITHCIVRLSIFFVSCVVAENTPVKRSPVVVDPEGLFDDSGYSCKKVRYAGDCVGKISFDDESINNNSVLDGRSLALSFNGKNSFFQKEDLTKLIEHLATGIDVKIDPFLRKLYEENPSLAYRSLNEVDYQEGLDYSYEIQECLDLFLRHYSLLPSISEDDKILVKELLRLGANPYYQDFHKNTAAYYAAVNRTDFSMLALLLQANIDISEQNRFHENILYSAVEAGCLENTKRILAAAIKVGREYCLKIVNAKNTMHHTPLYLAIEQGSPLFVKILLQYGADCSLQRDNGNTPLHDAVWRDNEDGKITRMLLAYGAGTATRNHNGDVPLHSAVQKEVFAGTGAIKALLEEDLGSYKWKNNAGVTPLHCAAEEGHVNFVDALLKNEDCADYVDCDVFQDCLDKVNVILSSQASSCFSPGTTARYSRIAEQLKKEIDVHAEPCVEESSSSDDGYATDGSI